MGSNTVISIENKLKETHNKKKEIVEKIRDRISSLVAFRGDVITKNNIRNLPDVSVGQIFWVSSEEKAYIVTNKEGKKVTIKALDESATISTGITIYEMNKSIVEKEPIFDMSEPDYVSDLLDDIVSWFTNECPGVYYLAYGKDLHYVTLFKKSSKYSFDKKSAKGLLDTLAAVGELISMEFESDRIEIWIRTKDALAELIYLMPYDNALVRLN